MPDPVDEIPHLHGAVEELVPHVLHADVDAVPGSDGAQILKSSDSAGVRRRVVAHHRRPSLEGPGETRHYQQGVHSQGPSQFQTLPHVRLGRVALFLVLADEVELP